MEDAIWEPDNGRDLLSEYGRLPDGRRVSRARREPNEEEQKEIDAIIEYNRGYVPTAADIARAQEIEAQTG